MPKFFDVHASLNGTLAVKSKTDNTEEVYSELQEYVEGVDVQLISLYHRGANLLFTKTFTLDDVHLDFQQSNYTDEKVNQVKSTVITKHCVENGLKVIYLDSDCTLIKEVIDECVKIVRNRKADLGIVTINGVDLIVTAQSDYTILHEYYLKEQSLNLVRLEEELFK